MSLHDNYIGDIIHEVTCSRSSCWCIFSTLMGLYFWSQKKRCIMDLEAVGFGDCLGKHYYIFGWYWRGDWLHWTRRVVPIQFWFPRRRENFIQEIEIEAHGLAWFTTGCSKQIVAWSHCCYSVDAWSFACTASLWGQQGIPFFLLSVKESSFFFPFI